MRGALVAIPIAILAVASGALAGVPGFAVTGLKPTTVPLATSTMTPLLNFSKGVAASLSAAFWGADVRPYYSLDNAKAAEFNATPVDYVRWPGGSSADQYNLSANRLYSDGGSYYTPPSSLSQFATWCTLVGCKAILQLPAEIDSPSTAAYYVAYSEKTLGFYPAYWEIGNEPALWTHFGFGWSAWNTSQRVNATPGTYAAVVHAYAAAIHKVDPSARICGLAGVGTGAYDEAVWIAATVALNGPNLSAVAIHVYPAGGTTLIGSTPSIAGFLATLGDPSSIAVRFPADRAAIASSCSTCHITILVTEMGSTTPGSPYSAYTSGPVLVPYLAAEVAQAMLYDVTNIDLFAFQSTYNGSLLNNSGAPTPIYTLYRDMMFELQPEVLAETISSAPARFYAVAAHDSTGKNFSLLIVNANASISTKFTLALSGFPLLGSGSAWAWGYGATSPKVTTWSTAVPLLWSVPARSVLVLDVTV